jgi:uncharacterized CHY-type Zn-finger protein
MLLQRCLLRVAACEQHILCAQCHAGTSTDAKKTLRTQRYTPPRVSLGSRHLVSDENYRITTCPVRTQNVPDLTRVLLALRPLRVTGEKLVQAKVRLVKS